MTQHKKSPITMIGGFSAFMLTAVAALLAVICMIAGMRAYYSIRDDAAANAAKRTGIEYIIGKLRMLDESTELQVTDNADGQVLHIIQREGEDGYETCIFCRDGELHETFAEYPANLDALSGERVADAVGLNIVPGNLWKITLRYRDNTTVTQHVAVTGEVTR